MPTVKQWKNQLSTQKGQTLLSSIYGHQESMLEKQLQRYQNLLSSFEQTFGDLDVRLFSTPGRSEIGGNHTDHNHGRVLAAAVSVDIIAVVSPRNDKKVTIWSQGYDRPFILNLTDLNVQNHEKSTSLALIRGVAQGISQLGYEVNGFDAYMTSDVLRGSGLSSSAAFEVLVCTIFDHLFCGGKIDAVTRARIAQFSENVYFGKPCGLMDQTACSVGAMMSIDFQNPHEPVVNRVFFDFEEAGYALYVVDTRGDHANLTPEYASIGAEMHQVARILGGRVLRDVSYDDLMDQIAKLRDQVGDRAILRSIHFFEDNDRVKRQVELLEQGNIHTFLDEVIASGESSWKWLQNTYVAGQKTQAPALGLAICQKILQGNGAWRVHGGGFAGTIQAFVPGALEDSFVSTMEGVFGNGACTRLNIRSLGSVELEAPKC